MCGIAGIYAPRGGEGLVETVRAMSDALAHRGPDGSGVWGDPRGRCALGHRRLAIIDLGEEGAQPMRSADGRFALTYNGEIYNFKELRAELEGRGTRFRGHSDTEVLVEAIAAWGVEAALERAVGMFAAALWDLEEGRLWLFRDRAGKKPLYYTLQGGRLWFASEIKGLRRVAGLELNLDREALGHYLGLAYVPAPLTIYREVREVPPGCVMSLDEGLEPRIAPYWRLPVGGGRRVGREEAVEQVEALLDEAVALRLRADVPVGVFLSGGIDSGLITALAARRSAQPVRTFSATFGSSAFDESPLARQVAERYATEHHELRLTPQLDELLPAVAAAYDEPFADPSAIPTYAIAGEAARHVKVVLNGEGSDELFGGYRRHRAVNYFTRVAGPARLLSEAGWRRLHAALPRPRGFRTPYSFLYRFLRGFGAGPYGRYLLWGSDGFTEAEKGALLGDAPPPTEAFLAEQFADLLATDPLSHFMAVDFLSGMADCLLVKVDVATMAHSLEGRSPFLDHRVVEWAAGLDRRDLLHGRESKPILRALARRHLPSDLVGAPKRGFEIPLVEWVHGPLRTMIGDLCLREGGIVLELFDRDGIAALVDGRGEMDDERRAKRLWILLMLALWDLNRQ